MLKYNTDPDNPEDASKLSNLLKVDNTSSDSVRADLDNKEKGGDRTFTYGGSNYTYWNNWLYTEDNINNDELPFRTIPQIAKYISDMNNAINTTSPTNTKITGLQWEAEGSYYPNDIRTFIHIALYLNKNGINTKENALKSHMHLDTHN